MNVSVHVYARVHTDMIYGRKGTHWMREGN